MKTRWIGATAIAVTLSACGPEAEMARPPPTPSTPAQPMSAGATGPATTPAPAAAQPSAPKPPLADLQKRAIMTYVAGFNAHDTKKMAEILRADAIATEPGPQGLHEASARQGTEGLATTLFAAFPDIKMAATRAFIKGDVAAYEWVSTATHKGEKGGPKPVGIAGATLFWFDGDGLVKAEHTYYDAATINTQIAGKVKARAVPALPSGDPEWHVAKGSPDEDKAVDLVKGYYGTYEKKADKDFLGMLADAAVHSSMTVADDAKGKDALRKEFHSVTKAFPDIKMTPSNAWASDGFVVAEVVMSGTHKGNFGAFGATNKPVTLHGLDVIQVADGKIAKSTSYASSYEFYGAIGVLPQPKPEKAKPTPKPQADTKPQAEAKPQAETKQSEAKTQSDKAAGAKPAAAADDPYADTKPLKLKPLPESKKPAK